MIECLFLFVVADIWAIWNHSALLQKIGWFGLGLDNDLVEFGEDVIFLCDAFVQAVMDVNQWIWL
jgi:hypothetical protein